MAGERVLVVDDGADMRDFVTKYVLKPNGYGTLEARDGLEAFDQIVEQSPDLVLLDLQMPRLDGLGLLRKLRDAHIEVPIVLMTFFGSEEIAIEVFRLGVRGYVIKPFTDDELLTTINHALNEVRLRHERDTLQDQLVSANREMQRRLRAYQSLVAVGQATLRLSHPDDLIQRCVRTAADVTGVTEVQFLILNPDGQSFTRRAQATGPHVSMMNEHMTSGLAIQALTERRTLISDPSPDLETERAVLQVCAPILANGERFAVVLASIPADTFAEQHLNLLEMLGIFASVAFSQVT